MAQKARGTCGCVVDIAYPCERPFVQGLVALRSAWLVSPLCGPGLGAHMLCMRKAIFMSALAALSLLCPLAGAQENPLLSPPPGLPGLPVSPSPLDAERGRAQADSLRNGADLSLTPAPDPMQRRDADALRLDADRALRALQDPQPPTPSLPAIDGPPAPRIDPPEPRISHGRKQGTPTPAQSSPVPARKPGPPDP